MPAQPFAPRRSRLPDPLQLILCALLAVTAAACGTTSNTAAGPGRGGRGPGRGDPPAVPVVTAPVEVKSVPVTLDAVGTVETIASVAIRSQVTGQLRDIGFEPGQDVRKGQPLFSLDPRPFEAALRQAEAVVARDTAQADDAASRATREKNLFDRGLIPRDQYDAQVASADALGASLAADQAQVDQARLNLQYANIAAPTDGRTGALMAHVGDLVRANDTNPLVTINQLSPIYVTFSVPARHLVDIRHNAARAPLEVAV